MGSEKKKKKTSKKAPAVAKKAKTPRASKKAKAPQAPPSKPAKAPSQATGRAWQPTEEQIRERARHIWEKGGRKPGTALSDWVEAERQLRSERGQASAK